MNDVESLVKDTIQLSDSIFLEIERVSGFVVSASERADMITKLTPHLESHAEFQFNHKIAKGKRTWTEVVKWLGSDFQNWICCEVWKLASEEQQVPIAKLLWDSISSRVQRMAEKFANKNPSISRITNDLARGSKINDVADELVGYAYEYFLKTSIRLFSLDKTTKSGEQMIGITFWTYFEMFCIKSCLVKLIHPLKSQLKDSVSLNSPNAAAEDEGSGTENQTMMLNECLRRFHSAESDKRKGEIYEILDKAVDIGELPAKSVAIFKKVDMEDVPQEEVATEFGYRSTSGLARPRNQVAEYLKPKLG